MNKKIVYIIKDISVIGGREIITLKKAEILSELGYEVYILCDYIKNKKSFDNINTISLFDVNTNYTYQQRINRLNTEIKKINPLVIISMLESNFWDLLKINKSIKKIIEVHGSYDFYLSHIPGGKIFKYIKFQRLKYRLSRFDKVVLLSEIDNEKWSLKNSSVISNFITPYKIDEKIDLSKKYKFVSCGRLSKEKGFNLLIDTWEIIKSKGYDISIDIYGEGGEYLSLQDKIKEKKLCDNIKIYPFDINIKNRLNQYYGYILPSKFECFPLVVLESLYSGIPVLSFDLECGVRDMIDNNVNGFLIKPFDIHEMANKIIELSMNQNMTEIMSKEAEKKAEGFYYSHVIKKWIKLFNQ